MPRFEVVTHVIASPGTVFDLSLDVGLHTASMAESSEKVVGGVTAGRLKLGESVTWQARHFGVRWRMTSAITAYDRPGFFVDEQVSGPFKQWHHAHRFQSDGHGGTVMRDVIDFAAPLGPLGTIAEVLALRRYLPRLIRARNQHIKEVAESAPRAES
ncbi:SRPBCC family protein [Sphaerisporangium sp. TRM90804]|uniref:SRPBCC family protein n=1 Tax=Sphaerisporangium sp. TRM90804 TaxID=3031113 RepID=UPI00244ADF09|nr:SRPBCC family protein [Sphaerisporangium sp. TRM90804]MDH2428894.1 SRPBCC family protein [Sphaerisporangium sp. TRM90804]